MSLIDVIRNVAIALSVLVILIGAVLLLTGPEKLSGLIGRRDLPAVDFATLEHRPGPQAEGYLVCPADACPLSAPDETAPRLAIPVERLRARLFEYVESSPRIRSFRLDPAHEQYVFLESDPGMTVPDVVTVRLYPTPDGGSTLAIYSWSPRGTDPARQGERIRRWLVILAGKNS
ncbi:MAG: hypothetical protein ACE5ED_12805 [Rhodothalassiaceae bacterium]